jgi:hypothetical protein
VGIRQQRRAVRKLASTTGLSARGRAQSPILSSVLSFGSAMVARTVAKRVPPRPFPVVCLGVIGMEQVCTRQVFVNSHGLDGGRTLRRVVVALDVAVAHQLGWRAV